MVNDPLPSISHDSIPAYDLDFARGVLVSGLDYYRVRADQLGWQGKTILDAACGIGNWSVPLAEQGNRVIALDLRYARLLFAKRWVDSLKRAGILVAQGNLERLPIDDESLDAVYCNGVFMFVHPKITMAEFRRVLKPNGRLFISGNGLGWSLYLLIVRGFFGREWKMIPTVWRTISSTWKYRFLGRPFTRGYSYISRGFLSRLLSRYGFELEYFGPEGSYTFDGSRPKVPPTYRGRFLGIPCVFDAMALKTEAAEKKAAGR